MPCTTPLDEMAGVNTMQKLSPTRLGTIRHVKKSLYIMKEAPR